VNTILDWSASSHWQAGAAQPCRYCQQWTPLLDSAGRPAHKLCAEKAIDAIRARKERAS